MEQALVGRGEHTRPQCMGVLGAVPVAECRGHVGRWGLGTKALYLQEPDEPAGVLAPESHVT